MKFNVGLDPGDDGNVYTSFRVWLLCESKLLMLNLT